MQLRVIVWTLSIDIVDGTRGKWRVMFIFHCLSVKNSLPQRAVILTEYLLNLIPGPVSITIKTKVASTSKTSWFRGRIVNYVATTTLLEHESGSIVRLSIETSASKILTISLVLVIIEAHFVITTSITLTLFY